MTAIRNADRTVVPVSRSNVARLKSITAEAIDAHPVLSSRAKPIDPSPDVARITKDAATFSVILLGGDVCHDIHPDQNTDPRFARGRTLIMGRKVAGVSCTDDGHIVISECDGYATEFMVTEYVAATKHLKEIIADFGCGAVRFYWNRFHRIRNLKRARRLLQQH